MTPIQRYELIRPILQGDKSVMQVHRDTQVPLPTLYRYLKRFREGNGQLESLSDKSHAPHSHPKWFTDSQKELVVRYKRAHPQKSARQIAKELTASGRLSINYHSVADILQQRHASDPPLWIHQANSMI